LTIVDRGARSAILLVTETSDLAADLLVLAARKRRLPLIRFNQDEFPQHTQIDWQGSGETRFHSEGDSFVESDITGAWFRRKPLLHIHHDHVATFIAREIDAFLGGVWETASWFWMNRPSAVTRAELKLLQLRHARSLGFTIPATLATNYAEAARCFAGPRANIAKTLAGGSLIIEGIDHAIFTTAVTADDITADEEIQACPVIFQPRIPTSFDLRVTVVADTVFAARIVLQDRTEQDVDWRRADPARLYYERHVLPAGLESKCVKLISAMGLTYSALDFVVTPQGEHVFLELNPSGQWGWIERALGLPIADTILDRLMEGQPCA
jgi:glutathione synthase/RimK-type ligase-like ATP-grasp enzyme